MIGVLSDYFTKGLTTLRGEVEVLDQIKIERRS